MKDHLSAWMGRETITSSTVQYARLLDFLTKKLKIMQLVANKGSYESFFCSRFCFLYFFFFEVM